MYTVPTIHAIICSAQSGQHETIKPYLTNQFKTILRSINQPQPLVWSEGAPKNMFALSPHTCRSVPGGGSL